MESEVERSHRLFYEFLASLDDQEVAGVLKEIRAIFMSNKNRDDNYLRRQKNRVQKYLDEERARYQQEASEWAQAITRGVRARLEQAPTIDAGYAAMDRFKDSIQCYTFMELEKYQRELKKRQGKTSIQLGKIDRDMYAEHEKVLLKDEMGLLGVFRKFKRLEENAVARGEQVGGLGGLGVERRDAVEAPAGGAGTEEQSIEPSSNRARPATSRKRKLAWLR